MTKFGLIILSACFLLASCSRSDAELKGSEVSPKGNQNGTTANEDGLPELVTANSNAQSSSNSNKNQKPLSQPNTVREFFFALPKEYFVVEDCDLTKDSDCKDAKEAYLKKYVTTEDLKNGYLEGGGDGAQSAFKMAIFKRPNGSYLAGLNVLGEAENSSKFLDFVDGKWEDVSIEIVPEFSTTNIYEIPQKGTTVSVFAKRILEQREDFEVSEKGEKLYELEWNGGEFSVKK